MKDFATVHGVIITRSQAEAALKEMNKEEERPSPGDILVNNVYLKGPTIRGVVVDKSLSDMLEAKYRFGNGVYSVSLKDGSAYFNRFPFEPRITVEKGRG